MPHNHLEFSSALVRLAPIQEQQRLVETFLNLLHQHWPEQAATYQTSLPPETAGWLELRGHKQVFGFVTFQAALEPDLEAVFREAATLVGCLLENLDLREHFQPADTPNPAIAWMQTVMGSPEGVNLFALDREYRYLAFTTAHADTIQRIWGTKISLGLEMLSVIRNPADRQKARANFDRVLDGETLIVEEEYGDHQLERSFWEDHYVPIRTGAQIIGLMVFVTDLTRHKRQQDALKESEERFQRAMDASKDGVWDWNIADGETYYSPGYFTILGYPPGKFPPHVQTWLDLIHPDDRAAALQANQACIDNQVEIFSVEFRMLAADGNWKWIVGRGKAVARDTNGQATRLVGTHTDITARKLAEHALRESEEKYRTLFETMVQGVVYQAPNGEIISANPAAQRILGLSLDQLQGRNSIDPRWKAIHSDGSDFPGETHPSMIALATGKTVRDVMMGIFAPDSGTHRWININAMPQFRPGENTPYQVCTTFEDITARKLAEAEIRQFNTELEKRVIERTAQMEVANRELESFAYSVSHDLRAPLRAIDGFSRIVMDDHADELSEEVKRLLHTVRAESQRMGQLIDALLELSRMSRTDLHPETLNLSALANTILQNLARTHPTHPVELIITKDISAEGDPRLLRIALENLLGNAWKFTSRTPQAKIEFGCHQEGRERVYYVRDNGAGFDMAYASKLFGAFQRLHKSSEFEGTGIGLATVQRIIHRHGGRIWAEAAPEQGAIFSFTLAEKGHS